MWFAMMTTIPISSSLPTKAPQPFPTSPMPSRASIISGSTTRSRRAVRPAMTTRRWGSARAALAVSAEKLTPQELMNAILQAPVDLLFFGGIGTFVRASSETNESVGDRANDAIRVTGAQLHAKAIGEGANLGMTQRGRVE